MRHSPKFLCPKSSTSIMNGPIHSFLVGCLNPCLQGASVWVGSPQPCGGWALGFLPA